jgi:hypothetical protein
MGLMKKIAPSGGEQGDRFFRISPKKTNPVSAIKSLPPDTLDKTRNGARGESYEKINLMQWNSYDILKKNELFICIYFDNLNHVAMNPNALNQP